MAPLFRPYISSSRTTAFSNATTAVTRATSVLRADCQSMRLIPRPGPGPALIALNSSIYQAKQSDANQNQLTSPFAARILKSLAKFAWPGYRKTDDGRISADLAGWVAPTLMIEKAIQPSSPSASSSHAAVTDDGKVRSNAFDQEVDDTEDYCSPEAVVNLVRPLAPVTPDLDFGHWNSHLKTPCPSFDWDQDSDNECAPYDDDVDQLDDESISTAQIPIDPAQSSAPTLTLGFSLTFDAGDASEDGWFEQVIAELQAHQAPVNWNHPHFIPVPYPPRAHWANSAPDIYSFQPVLTVIKEDQPVLTVIKEEYVEETWAEDDTSTDSASETWSHKSGSSYSSVCENDADSVTEEAKADAMQPCQFNWADELWD